MAGPLWVKTHARQVMHMLVHRFWGQLCAAHCHPNLAWRTRLLSWCPDNVNADLEQAKAALAHVE